MTGNLENCKIMDSDILVERAFENLINSLRPGTTDENKEKIRHAYEFAKAAHVGIKRRSGEPYILHPIAVAQITAKEIGLGTTSVIAALLHDVVEDTDYTVEDIGNLFGERVASIVDGLTKISEVTGQNSSKQAESFRKMILTLADDVRVILIKIADRLHNMRTLSSMPEHKQVKIAGETLYIYAPLAHRMGLHAIKTELEDLSLKYEHPEEYRIIADKIYAYHQRYTLLLERFIAPIRTKLDENGYVFSISSRTKSVYSVWRKMQKRNISFDEIYDLLAVRIVFNAKDGQPEKWQCWNIYSLITDLYSPKPERIRDWLSVPKANGYEALHVTVMGPAGQWFEVQIRSKRMDDIAERGLAAHWKYKNDGESSELDKWLSGVKEILDQPDVLALEFLDEFKMNLFAKEIRVFTPKGYMRTLPKNATALDFAYDIHSEIGNKCIGAKVNHRLVPMSHRLQSGDQVEILTSEKQFPQREWLNFIITAKARAHINVFLKKERKEQIRVGKEKYKDIINKLALDGGVNPLEKLLRNYDLPNKDELYLNISKDILSYGEIEKVLKKKPENFFVKYWKLQFSKSDKKDVVQKPTEHEINEENPDITIAPCCNPIPGDDVVGMNIAGDKIIVHKRSCPDAIRLMASFGDKIVPVKWVSQKLMSFLAVINLNGIDSSGIVSEISTLISQETNITLRLIHFESKDGVFEGVLHLYVHNTDDLTRLLHKLKDVKGIINVKRVEN
ncbi:MAG: RelA/SpoT family protein [Marinifilaceae bacterium]